MASSSAAADPRPIGVFDSGVGGLTVARALMDLLPDERIVYFGDTAQGPGDVSSVPASPSPTSPMGAYRCPR